MADEFIPELTLNPNSPLAGQGQAAAAPAPAAHAPTAPARAVILADSGVDAPRGKVGAARPVRQLPACGSPRPQPRATT